MNRTDLATLIALPPRAEAPPSLVSAEMSEREGYVLERLAIDLGETQPVRALLTRPVMPVAPLPAVLYCHAHGAKYDIGASELIDGRSSLFSAYGPVLARAGFLALCLDMPTFGGRQSPAEDPLAKALLWHGKTLMGKMLGDLLAGFDYLSSRPDVDAKRIAALGLSMGATHSYFLGALEPRLARIAHLCCFADWASLLAAGAHDLHGHYMTIPGLLAKTSVGAIAGMIAPRPQLVCVGLEDPLTPPAAVDRAFEETEVAYRRAHAESALTLIREPETGHIETPKMREAVLAFLAVMKV
jgi:dienelactone hydrolase